MNLDHKGFLAIALCVIFYLAYNQYLQTKYPEYQKRRNQTAETQNVPPEGQGDSQKSASQGSSSQGSQLSQPAPPTNQEPVPAQPQESIPQLDTEQLTFRTDKVRFQFSQQLGGFSSIQLRDYRVAADRDAPPVELAESPFLVHGTINPAYRGGAQNFHGERQGDRVRFWRDEAGWRISQTYEFQSEYGGVLTLDFENRDSRAQELTAIFFSSQRIEYPEQPSGLFAAYTAQRPAVEIEANGSLARIDVREFCEDDDGNSDAVGKNRTVRFFGYDHHYFLKAFMPENKNISYNVDREPLPNESCRIFLRSYQNFGMVESGAKITVPFRFFFGPKDLDVMAAVDPVLQSSIDLGFFDLIAKPLLMILRFFYDLTKNFGIAIIILTTLLKICFYPLTKRAAVSMKKMQKLQPEMQRIRERHKEDPRRQQQELMKFMGENKVNPMKGCLPILPQIPVFVALYNVLLQAIELRHAPFAGWIMDLSSKDPYFVTPIILGAGMLLQQKLTPTAGMDKTQARIMMMMPVVFTVVFLTLPSGLVLYMLTNTIISIAQQQWLNKKLEAEFGLVKVEHAT